MLVVFCFEVLSVLVLVPWACMVEELVCMVVHSYLSLGIQMEDVLILSFVLLMVHQIGSKLCVCVRMCGLCISRKLRSLLCRVSWVWILLERLSMILFLDRVV